MSSPKQARSQDASRRACAVALMVWCVLLAPTVADAQDVPVPIETHLPICMAALPFDRKLKERVGEELVVGIIYQARFLASTRAHEEALRVLNELSTEEVDGVPVRYVSLPVSREEDVERAVLDGEADILYIAPLRAMSLASITRVSRAHDLMTWSGVTAYADEGVTLTVDARGGKPEIVINLSAMVSEGVDFTAALLDYARVINIPAKAEDDD